MNESKGFTEILAECIESIEVEGIAAQEQFCCEHPEHAEALREHLGELRQLDLLNGSSVEECEPRPSSAGRSSVLATLDRAAGGRPRLRLLPDEDGPEDRCGTGGRNGIARVEKTESKYEILGELGHGGMGVVYRAEDRDLCRRVALKFLRKKLRSREDYDSILRRFLEEAQITGQLEHPGIVPVHELGVTTDGQPYFAMKLVRGETLATAVDKRSSPQERLAEMISIFRQACLTVAFAHARGVIHRDLKPENVLLGRFGEVLIVDWGLGKVLGRDSALSAASDTAIITTRSRNEGTESRFGLVLGTPQYMAPEQAEGDISRTGKASDVFSLGSILCEILTGAPAYVVDSSADDENRDDLLMAMVLRADLAEARSRLRRCGADEVLVQLALDCLSREPEARPADAGEVATRVGNYQQRVEERARAARVEVETARHRGRLKVVVAAVLAVAVCVAAWLANEMRKMSAMRKDQVVADLLSEESRFRDLLPTDVEPFERWLARANPILETLPALERTLRTLQEGAVASVDHLPKSRREKLEREEQWLESLVRADGVRRRCARLSSELKRELLAGLPEKYRGFSVRELNNRAYGLSTDPKCAEEKLVLQLALAAWEAADTIPEKEFAVADTMAHALFLNGFDEDAKSFAIKAIWLARKNGNEDLITRYQSRRAQLEARILGATDELRGARRRVQKLSLRWRRWSFEPAGSGDEHEAASVRVLRLWKLREARDRVERMLRDVAAVARLQRDEKIAARWETARAEIRSSCLYSGWKFDLPFRPDLVPIGENPQTGLWEFYHPASAAHPESVPTRDENTGRIRVTKETGIVFVLLPGSEAFAWETRDSDKKRLEQTGISIEPFYLSRYELTKAQWERLSGGRQRVTGQFHDRILDGQTIGASHPATFMSWTEGRRVLAAWRMKLPDTKQWAYGHLAGDGSEWLRCHSEEHLLARVRAGKRSPLPVGQLEPNRWGLHDTLGNIREWCDGNVPLTRPVVGGCYSCGPDRILGFLASGNTSHELILRTRWHEDDFDVETGLRPAMELRHKGRDRLGDR